MTSLHAAARNGNAELVQDILEGRNGQAKVSINSQNSTGQTAMHLAAKWSRLNVIKLLIEAGADMEIKDRRGRTPFHALNFFQWPQQRALPAHGIQIRVVSENNGAGKCLRPSEDRPHGAFTKS